jgi:hypothetical protein
MHRCHPSGQRQEGAPRNPQTPNSQLLASNLNPMLLSEGELQQKLSLPIEKRIRKRQKCGTTARLCGSLSGCCCFRLAPEKSKNPRGGELGAGGGSGLSGEEGGLGWVVRGWTDVVAVSFSLFLLLSLSPSLSLSLSLSLFLSAAWSFGASPTRDGAGMRNAEPRHTAR